MYNDRDSRSNLYRASLPLEVEAYFPFRMWLSASLAGGMSMYWDPGSRSFHREFGMEPAIAIGHLF